MKSLEKILKKLNNLLILNYEIENVYLEALDLAGDDHLKAFLDTAYKIRFRIFN